AWQFRALPSYDKNMSVQDEQDIFTIFSGTSASAASMNTQMHQNLYDHSNYNYDNLFRNRHKDKLKDKPLKREFRLRQQETHDQDNLQSRGYERENQYVNEPEEMAVRN